MCVWCPLRVKAIQVLIISEWICLFFIRKVSISQTQDLSVYIKLIMLNTEQHVFFFSISVTYNMCNMKYNYLRLSKCSFHYLRSNMDCMIIA